MKGTRRVLDAMVDLSDEQLRHVLVVGRRRLRRRSQEPAAGPTIEVTAEAALVEAVGAEVMR